MEQAAKSNEVTALHIEEELRNKKLKTLDNYHFTGSHASHIGAIQSSLAYYGIEISASSVFGLTGHAFLMVVDSGMANPNVGLPEEDFFQLAGNLGIHIDGISRIVTGDELQALQAEAWDRIRGALDNGQPAFAKELGIGNETSVINAYGTKGYFAHSWHGGDGHEGWEDEIPWTTLGRNYCPCRECRDRPLKPSTDLYLGMHTEGAFLSYHWVTRTDVQKDLRQALREALAFTLQFNSQKKYTWGKGIFFTGVDAYDAWIDSVRTASIHGFYMGYFVDVWQESRHHAAQFLRELQSAIPELQTELEASAVTYAAISNVYWQLNELFPWMQPREPIADPFRRKDAINLLTEAKELERTVHSQLEKLFARL
ncbi:hypothetical protein H8B09_24980 [Paenibacillus sp. PR3]|uniref:Uncharacterized protein n=1 Tax=Paenibacillus terricola TaxID=2763503 RepID=A0ABR8N1I7_9BACL|nr:hypothetical protein [Paenibacillus terricola]MBD3922040.1 hypothetical protein [Paenibacillus terricola]